MHKLDLNEFSAGETFMLNAMPIWVQQIAVGLSVSQGAES